MAVSVRYIVHDVDAAIAFSDILRGVGGDQALVEDPSGNPIELFSPAQR